MIDGADLTPDMSTTVEVITSGGLPGEALGATEDTGITQEAASLDEASCVPIGGLAIEAASGDRGAPVSDSKPHKSRLSVKPGSTPGDSAAAVSGGAGGPKDPGDKLPETDGSGEGDNEGEDDPEILAAIANLWEIMKSDGKGGAPSPANQALAKALKDLTKNPKGDIQQPLSPQQIEYAMLQKSGHFVRQGGTEESSIETPEDVDTKSIKEGDDNARGISPQPRMFGALESEKLAGLLPEGSTFNHDLAAALRKAQAYFKDNEGEDGGTPEKAEGPRKMTLGAQGVTSDTSKPWHSGEPVADAGGAGGPKDPGDNLPKTGGSGEDENGNDDESPEEESETSQPTEYPTGKYNVSITGSTGVIVGDNVVASMTHGPRGEFNIIATTASDRQANNPGEAPDTTPEDTTKPEEPKPSANSSIRYLDLSEATRVTPSEEDHRTAAETPVIGLPPLYTTRENEPPKDEGGSTPPSEAEHEKNTAPKDEPEDRGRRTGLFGRVVISNSTGVIIGDNAVVENTTDFEDERNTDDEV